MSKTVKTQGDDKILESSMMKNDTQEPEMNEFVHKDGKEKSSSIKKELVIKSSSKLKITKNKVPGDSKSPKLNLSEGKNSKLDFSNIKQKLSGFKIPDMQLSNFNMTGSQVLKSEIAIFIYILIIVIEGICAIQLLDMKWLIVFSVLLIEFIMGLLLYKEQFPVLIGMLVVQIVIGIFTKNLVILLMGFLVFAGIIFLIRTRNA